MSAPADQAARERFQTEIARNFSVVASAGSGKTRAITDRIVAIAQKNPELLPDLVVVTFTNRAADEMQGRARQQMLEAKVNVDVLAWFNRAFFGTIHSFCLKLLREHGFRLGLPATLDLVMDDDELWNDFVQRQTTVGASLTPANRALLLRHVQVRQLMELGRRADAEIRGGIEPGPCPELDVAALLDFGADKRSIETIAGVQRRLRAWNEARESGVEFLPMPRCSSSAKAFVKLWGETFRPLRDWLNCCSLSVAAEVQGAYRAFRLEKGLVTYADQVALAGELLQNEVAARRIRGRNYRVILDEAQDTDPQQFGLLLEITRPVEATGVWPEVAEFPPRAGHFCMVGDFQQSIFGDRADLAHYRRIHEKLVSAGAADALTFSVTFRLDREEIDLVNGTFQDILHGEEDQVEFVELSPRPDVLPGQVIRLDLKSQKLANAGTKIPEGARGAAIAAELARWIAQAGLINLRAQNWRDVAILCPRKSWLPPLRDALRDEGLAVQVQSDTELKGDNPGYAWFTALARIMAEPRGHYEIVGVLREVFGISDHDLAVFSGGDGARFQIKEETSGLGGVEKTLTLLSRVCAEIAPQPLFRAVTTLLEKTQLRARLGVLPDVDDEAEAELDALLVSAADAEARRATFADFAERLRGNFEARREARAADRDAIQLITAQKAKGSEWQAVIVPFLSRAVRGRPRAYPAVIRNPATGDRFVVLSGEDVTPEIKTAIERADRQEMERTLYVALTRAKHTLVLATDGGAFHDAKGALQKNSQMKWLRCDGGDCNEETFRKLGSESRACAETQRFHLARAAGQAEDRRVRPLPLLDKKTVAAARRAADAFVHKVNPSGLSENVRTLEGGEDNAAGGNVLMHSTFDNAATRYGSWWHELMERIPWGEPPAGWSRIFNSLIGASPEPERSQHEWQLLLRHIGTDRSFRNLLTGKEIVVHPEMPFYWNVDRLTCLEGIIDLALFVPATDRWLIVDWKTNRVGPGGASKLRERYRAQLAAYWKAVTQITKMPVDAGIFSSAAGAFLRYETSELEAEWSRLRGLSAGEIAAEITVEAADVDREFH